MITKKVLNKAIKDKSHLWVKMTEKKMLPLKIGRWNKVDCVLLNFNNDNRVVDLKYLLKNFNTKCLFF